MVGGFNCSCISGFYGDGIDCYGEFLMTDVYCSAVCLLQDQGRINHCAGCTMGGGFPPPAGPDQLPVFFTTLFDRLETTSFV